MGPPGVILVGAASIRAVREASSDALICELNDRTASAWGAESITVEVGSSRPGAGFKKAASVPSVTGSGPVGATGGGEADVGGSGVGDAGEGGADAPGAPSPAGRSDASSSTRRGSGLAGDSVGAGAAVSSAFARGGRVGRWGSGDSPGGGSLSSSGDGGPGGRPRAGSGRGVSRGAGTGVTRVEAGGAASTPVSSPSPGGGDVGSRGGSSCGVVSTMLPSAEVSRN